jgi:DNA-binding MarR family transcriptional regulator
MLSTLERGAHLIGAYLERTASELGITQAEAHVVAQIARAGPTPIAALHREFGHKRSTLTNVLDRLEERGLVRREPHPSDRRSIVIHLTTSGQRIGAHVAHVLDALEREVRGSVGVRDLQGVDAVVVALARALHRLDREDHPPR